MQLTASADKSAGPPLNLPSSGVNVIDQCWLGSAPLQGTLMGFAPVSAVVVRPPVRWDRVPETRTENPLRHVRVGVVRVPLTVATPRLGVELAEAIDAGFEPWRRDGKVQRAAAASADVGHPDVVGLTAVAEKLPRPTEQLTADKAPNDHVSTPTPVV